MNQFITIGFLTLGLSASAFAGDAANFRLLGFSQDNSKMAYADTAIGDGSGLAYASIQVVDIKNNKVLKTISAEDENENNPSESVALKKALLKAKLASYGIIVGKKMGKVLLQRLPTDYSQSTNTIFSVDSWAQGGATSTVPKYELLLEQKNVSSKVCDDEAMGFSGSIMKLSLKDKEGDATKVNMVLQQDRTIPKSRGCARDYHITQVIKSDKALVVVVNYANNGFEGPNTQHLVVTTDKVDLK